jgi:hypothetical protein
MILHSMMLLDPTLVRLKRTCVTNSIPLGCQLPLTVSTINCVETRKVRCRLIGCRDCGHVRCSSLSSSHHPLAATIELYSLTRTVRVFRQQLPLEDAIEFHAFAPLESSCMHATNDIPLGCSLLLPVHTVNCVQTLKAPAGCKVWKASTHCNRASGRSRRGALLFLSSFTLSNPPYSLK